MTKNKNTPSARKYKYGYVLYGGLTGGFDSMDSALENYFSFTGEDPADEPYDVEFIRYELGTYVPPSSPATVKFEGE